MKKYLTLVLSMLLVLGFAAGAFAIHAEIPSETQAVVAKGTTQITLGGELRVRGWYQKNIGNYNEWEEIDPKQLADNIANNLLGTTAVGIDFDGDGVVDDSISTADIADLVDDMGVTLYKQVKIKVPRKSTSQAWYDQRVRLWVDAQVTPNVQGFVMVESNAGTADTYTWGNSNSKPTGLQILQAWILYKGEGLFGFPAGIKIGHMPLALGEKQFFDHTKFGDDAIVLFMDPTKALHVGLLAIKLGEGVTTDNTDDLDAYVALMTYKINDKNMVGLNYTNLNLSDANLKLSNLGLHANGSAAGFGYKAEVDIQFGSVGDPKEKFRGYGVMLGGNYKVDPVNIRAGFAYGSGDNDGDDEKVKDFVTFLGNDQHYTLVYEYRVASTAGNINTGISNTTYYNLGVDVSPVKDVTASLDGYILRASKTSSSVSKNAGWEVDAKVVYKVAKNLTYQIDAGFFKAGKYYEDAYGIKEKNATVLRHALTLSF